MKSFTNIEQSKKLAEILPLESADMCWTPFDEKLDAYLGAPNPDAIKKEIPCWSLAALLGVLPDDSDIVKSKSDTENEHYMCTVGIKDDIISTFGNNPVNACVDIIEKLHELNLL